jgi:uncharacterized protein (UPF0548 family)
VNPALSPQWSLHPPGAEAIEAFRQGQHAARFSYAEVGASNAGAPAGYNLDHNRIVIGRGEADFAAACAAIRAWKMFPAPWTSITPADAPISEGTVVAMQARALGGWWMNACRIVYVVEENTPVRRFGFAYGTLPAHVEQGEERFSVELHADGTVWYDLRAFSRPRYWPVRLAKPLARRLQRKFVRDSQRAMQRAVQGESTKP